MRNNEPSGGGDKQPESPGGEHVKDCDAIAQGIAEMEADGGTALNEAFDDIRGNPS